MRNFGYKQRGGENFAALGSGALDDPFVPLFALGESPNLDAFGRLRVSNPEYVFDAQQTYDLQPLLFERITAGSGAAIAHDATNRCATLTFASTPTGGEAIMQTFEHFRYQPGRSDLTIITFNFKGGATNTLKFAGKSDGSNGVELQLNGATPRIMLYSDAAVGDQEIAVADWDDPLDGSGPSRKRVDWTKAQILVIDFQALYVGAVRLYLDIDRVLVPFCTIKNANIQANPYIQTANLPVRVGMTCTGEASTTMQFICASVISEGGALEPQGFEHSLDVSGTGGNDARAHILSLRPKATFNSIVNRSKIILESIDFIVNSGTNNAKFELVLGQAITGTTTFSDVNAIYSSMEYNTAGTISGSPAIVLFSGYASATGGARITAPRKIGLRYPITLDAAGVARLLGTASLLATGYTGTAPCRATVNWREVR